MVTTDCCGDPAEPDHTGSLPRMQTAPPARRVVALLAALLLLAAACGGGDTATDAQATDDSTSPAPSPIPASDDVLDVTQKPPVDESYLGDVEELTVTDLVEGAGAEAEVGSIILVQYVGVLAEDGSQFDSSWDSQSPLTINLGVGQVIPGWDEGLVGMQVGGRRLLQIPSDLGYGSVSPGPGIPADADLVFIVDLLDVRPPPPPTPTPLPAPPVPEDALGAFDELGIRDVVVGTGREIQPGDIVAVQYVGVDALTGEEFDSTWSRGGEPFLVIAGAAGVIEGWQQGLIGAQVGTERILQIPSDQAYGEGDLVFLIEVESVTEAPLAHTLSFDDPVPGDVVVTTLVEGSGDGAVEGDVVSGYVVVLRHSDGQIIQSTYQNDTVTPLFVSPEGLLPGLNDGMIGIRVGETRQVVVPAEVAFPDGVPQDAGVSAGDALVFVVEVVDISPLEPEE